MNHFYMEHSSRERIRELQAEGLRSQAYYRSLPARDSLFRRVRQFILSRLSSRAINRESPATYAGSEALTFEP